VIRIYRSRPGETFRTARDRPPEISVQHAPELMGAAMRVSPAFSGREIATLRLALEGMTDHTDVDIVLAGDGVLYHVGPPDRPIERTPTPADPKPAPRAIFSKAGGDLLLLDPRPALRSVLRDALEVLGYEARAVDARDEAGLLDCIRTREPEVVLVSRESAWAPPAALAGLQGRVATVLVTQGSVVDAPGWDAVVRHPLRIHALSSLLDPLVERVRCQRRA
jgi:hypothetical protein